MKFIALSLLMMISVNAFADLVCEEDPNNGGGGTAADIVKFVEGQECPNKKKLKNICMTIGGRMADKDKKNKYLYQTKILEAACVKAEDSENVKIEKIRKTWSIYESELKCTSTDFDIEQGSILKYAFVGEFDDFLDDTLKWKINLNIIDPSDGRTLLDYIQYYVNKNKGNSLEQRYKNYYTKFREAGAKHRAEL